MFSADWFSQNIKNWEVWLAKFKDKDNLNFLEIGCFEGRATLWLMQNILTKENCTMYVIDTFEGGMEAGIKGAHFAKDVLLNFQENLMIHITNIKIFQGLSQEVIVEDRSIREGKFDFIYIDGSHRSAEVLEDAVLSFRRLKSGGIMIFDDYGLKRYEDMTQNPKIGIDAFLSAYEGKYKLIAKKYQVCICKL